MAETVSALAALLEPRSATQRAFAAAHFEAFDSMLEEHPGRAALLSRTHRPGLVADYLGLPPGAGPVDFAAELDLLHRRGDEQIRADLLAIDPSPLPELLQRPGPAEYAVGMLDWVWTRTVSTDWARRSRVLQADIVSRMSRLASRGWAGVLSDLGGNVRWEGAGHLRINHYDLPSQRLPDDGELAFIPVHDNVTRIGWDLPSRFCLCYPVAGTGVLPTAERTDGLVRLLGATRATLLQQLAEPASTSGLVATTGFGLGTVGNHLQVLLSAGLVLRRRSGREVIYWRSVVADALVASANSPPARQPYERIDRNLRPARLAAALGNSNRLKGY